MTKPLSSIYLTSHPDLHKQLARRIDRGISNSPIRPQLFFRADDIGIPSRTFQLMIECFTKHHIPLCLATVPAWITPQRLQELSGFMEPASRQWCWHQHGWCHRNYETSGKKQEFGPSRSTEAITRSLRKGRNKLESLLGSTFQPFFTPPWNRCSQDTLETLVDLGFDAVSRSSNARPESPATLPDFQVNVDLHTRKERLPESGLTNMLTELEQSLAAGQCGIMIHHQRMNRRALELLDRLLQLFNSDRRLNIIHFGDMT